MKKVIIALSIGAIAGGAYFFTKDERFKTASTSPAVVPTMQLTSSDDKSIWGTTEDDEEPKASEKAKGATEASGQSGLGARDARQMRVDGSEEEQETEEDSKETIEETSFWGHLGKAIKMDENVETEEAESLQDSLRIAPHKKDFYWLSEIADSDEVDIEEEPIDE